MKMINEYQSYNVTTGRINSTLNIEDDNTHFYEENGETLIKGEGAGFKDYIDLTQSPPAITPRPAMPATQDKLIITADGNDAVTLSGLPEPCTVTIGGAVYDVPDGELEWATLMPTTYRIRVESFPYLNWEGEVTAVAGDIQAE
jgi:hypothetical protein